MAKKQKVVLCRNCNNTMVKGTKICPTCGAKNKKPFYKKWWFILIVFIVVVGLFGLIGGDSEKIDWNDLELGYELRNSIKCANVEREDFWIAGGIN